MATAKGVPVAPGVQTARIGWLLRRAGKVGLDLVAAKLASLLLLVAIRYRQLRTPVTEGKRHFFVGISALKEAELIPQFEAISGGPVTVIDQRFSGALASIWPPSTADLLRSWRDAARPVFADLASGHGVTVLDRSAVLAYVVRRLHHYAHFLAVFRGLNASDPGARVAFSSADLPAYAAVRAGIEAIYFPHGVQTRSLVFPNFHRVLAFNMPEAEHIQSRLPHALVSMGSPDIRPIRVARRVAVVGNYGDKLDRSRGLIEFCRAAGIDVVVRPHPADRSGYWNEWVNTGGVHIDRVGTFDEFLERHRPCVMATWYSTPVYEAVTRGVVPITLEADQPDIVFPFEDVALRWPEQKERIQAVLANDIVRFEALSRALQLAVGPQNAEDAIHKLVSVT